MPIPCPHFDIRIVQRSEGESAVAAAAYRSGETLTNHYDGVTHDFTRKGGIVHTEILLPPHAPPDFADRSILWNSVEKIEKAKNSQLAREIDAAIPIVMLTMRPFEESGEWGAKQKKEYILDKDGNKIYDRKKRQLKAPISKLQKWLKEEQENNEPPTLADYIQDILSRRAQEGKSKVSQSLYNLKDVAKMLNFLQANNIMDMAGLDEKFKSMIGKQLDIQGKLKPIERRLATLKKHIEQLDIYFKYKGKKKLTAEQIRKSVHSILRQKQREQAQRRAQDMER